VIVGPIGDADDLEPRAIVPLEKAGSEVGGRMLAVIGRQVGEPNPVVAVPRSSPKRRALRQLLAHVPLRAQPLFLGRG
jgi:hypothetical protein